MRYHIKSRDNYYLTDNHAWSQRYTMRALMDYATALREIEEARKWNPSAEIVKENSLSDDLEHKRAVLAACTEHYGMPTAELDGCHVLFIENYISDCPGYRGPVAIVVGTGGPELITVCVMRGGVWMVEASYPTHQEGT